MVGPLIRDQFDVALRNDLVDERQGGGGKLMHQLIGKLFLPAFRNPLLELIRIWFLGAAQVLSAARVINGSYTVQPQKWRQRSQKLRNK